MNRINITKLTDWLSIDESVLHLLFKLIELNLTFEKINFYRQGYIIELINVGGNIILLYEATRSIRSSVMLNREECVEILKSSNTIIKRIKDFTTVPVKESIDKHFPPFPIENNNELSSPDLTIENNPKRAREDFTSQYGQGEIIM